MMCISTKHIVHVINAPMPDVGTCATTILLAITLAPPLFLNDSAQACVTSISANLSAIAQVELKYNNE